MLRRNELFQAGVSSQRDPANPNQRHLRGMMSDRQTMEPEPYPAEKARGGDIVLRTPLRLAIFAGGLVAVVLVLLLLAIVR
jgi:hypothetical protein